MILRADAAAIALADKSVDCVVTSPPYWGLRAYAGEHERVWGGALDCAHHWRANLQPAANGIIHERGMSGETLSSNSATRKPKISTFCSACGAWRGALGLEPTPELYVQHIVQIFRDVRRVLKKRGTLWLNMGDCYATGAGKVGECPGGGEQGARWRGYRGQHGTDPKRDRRAIGAAGKGLEWEGGIGPMCQPNRMPLPGLKPKDLVGIPWRVAFALQADGWYLRRDIVWAKPNPMPESVLDRPTGNHEYLFLLTKAGKYFYDAEAIAEPQEPSERARRLREQQNGLDTVYHLRADIPHGQRAPGQNGCARTARARQALALKGVRNRRSVWEIATHADGAHFAVFPPELVRICVLAGCPEDGIVYDPFAGSGTVGQVAFKLGRHFILSDLAYQDLQLERVPPMADAMLARVPMALAASKSMPAQRASSAGAPCGAPLSF